MMKQWRNYFHIDSPLGLINDPNGLSYFDRKFHIFFQWNPSECSHKNKHWGLVTTKDFVSFSKPRIILKPDQWYDKDGCYSGSAYVKKNTLKLFYTGNVKCPDGERKSYQCLADYHKDGRLVKQGVIVESQPQGFTSNFRDPNVFVKNRTYYMVIGAQTQDLKGRALVYQSKDLKSWKVTGELKTELKNFGYMWECPNVFRIDRRQYAFLFSPQGLETEEFKFQNKYQSGYVIGRLNFRDFSLNHHTEFKEIDKGFDFYAPQVFCHHGKNIMIGWIGMPDQNDEYASSIDGWIFGLTFPRYLEYRKGVLYQRPYKCLKRLRELQLVDLKNQYVVNYKTCFESRALEYDVDLDLNSAGDIAIELKMESESILITYCKEDETCVIDRNNMRLGGKGIRRFKLKTDDSFRIRMFIDYSCMELYYQDGLEVATLAYFPECDDLEIVIKNKVKINKLQIWKLGRIHYMK